MTEDALFLPSGYANMSAIIESPAPFIFVIGGRGTGKTYGAAEACRGKYAGRSLWIRRRAQEIDAMKSGEPFGNVPSFAGCKWKGSKEASYVIGSDGERILPVIPFATSGNVTGLNLEHVELVVFDEFIGKAGSVPIANEFLIWSQLYESINRNRELIGRAPVKMLHLSNSDSLNSEILIELELVPVIVRMRSEGVRIWESPDGLLQIYDFSGSPISDGKRGTALYRLTAGSKFAGMALDNSFAFDDFSDVKRRPIKEYNPLFSVDGKVTLYIHKRRSELYASRHRSGNVPDYPSTKEGRRDLLRAFPYLHEALAEGCLYESIECKYLIQKIL